MSIEVGMLTKVPRIIPILSMALALSIQPEPASADRGGNPHPPVIPPNTPQYEQLVVDWYQYVFSVPANESPFLDEHGENALVGQSTGQGNVVFLVGLFVDSGTRERFITVRPGTKFFFPVVSSFAGCPDDFVPNEREGWEQGLELALNQPPGTFSSLSEEELVRLVVDTQITQGVQLPLTSVTIDDIPVTNLTSFRVKSPIFALNDLTFFFGESEASCYPVAADGYWIETTPLSVGTHEIHFQAVTEDPFEGLSSDFMDQALDITYHINVVPDHTLP